MQHLLSRRTESQIEVIYHLSPPEKARLQDDYYTYFFTRVGIGASYEEGVNYCVTVGERTFISDDEKRTSRFYVVIDEADAETSAVLVQKMIAMKDRYLVTTVYTLKEPRSIVETLRGEEGLTSYGRLSEGECRTRWPSFHGKGIRAGIYDLEKPSDAVLQRDIEAWLHDPVRHPDSKAMLLDSRLVFPEELNNREIRTAVRMNRAPYCYALWCVVYGLDSSRPITRGLIREKRQPNPITGY